MDTPDEEARKKQSAAETPLTQYFSGAPKPPKPAPAAPQQPAQPAVKPPTNTGQAATPPATAPQPAAAPVSQQRAPQPTGFTNFQRYFSANKDAAKAQADKLVAQTAASQQKAKDSLDAAKKGFGDPAGDRAATYKRFYDLQAKINAGGNLSGADLAEMQSLSEKLQHYDGPMQLDDKQAQADALEAQNNTNALGTEGGVQALINQGQSGSQGADALGSALTGAAGRNDFAGLRSKFNPESIADVQKKAMSDAAGAKTDADRLAGIESGRNLDRANGPTPESEADVEAAWNTALSDRGDLKSLSQKDVFLGHSIPGSPEDGVAGGAAAILGMTQDELKNSIKRMSDDEYGAFAKSGKLPAWMKAKNAGAFKGLLSKETLDAADDFQADRLGENEYGVNGFKYDPGHTVAASPNARAWGEVPIAGQYGLPGKDALGNKDGRITVHQRMKNAIVWARNWNKKHPTDQRTARDFGAMQQAYD